jgi:hypothetical protein
MGGTLTESTLPFKYKQESNLWKVIVTFFLLLRWQVASGKVARCRFLCKKVLLLIG